jgi:hypothetical protein
MPADPDRIARNLKTALKRISLLEDAVVSNALLAAGQWEAMREMGRILKKLSTLSGDPADIMLVGPGNKLRPLPASVNPDTAPGIWTVALELLTPEEREEILRQQMAAATIRLEMADRKAEAARKAKERADREAGGSLGLAGM